MSKLRTTCLVYVTLRCFLRNVLSQAFHGEAKRVLCERSVYTMLD